MIPHSRPSIGIKERKAADRILRSGMLAQGQETLKFEKESADFIGLKYAAAVSSGTKAIELVLRGLNIGCGDEVIIPSFVCSALWHAVIASGALPILADCEPETYNPCIQDIKRRMTRRTKAVILPHMFGVPADIASALALGVPVIEDCAQSLGAQYRSKPAGSYGAACIMSFYPTKVIAAGEGGMALSPSAFLIKKIKDLREYDNKPSDIPRQNAKMTDMEAGIGRVQLTRIEGFISAREKIAQCYNKTFGNLDVKLPLNREGRIYYRYVLKIPKNRLGNIIEFLKRKEISAGRSVYRPLHMDMACGGRFPVTQEAWNTLVSIPIYPSLSCIEVKKITDAVIMAVKRG